jgi:hypothetical protein
MKQGANGREIADSPATALSKTSARDAPKRLACAVEWLQSATPQLSWSPRLDEDVKTSKRCMKRLPRTIVIIHRHETAQFQV